MAIRFLSQEDTVRGDFVVVIDVFRAFTVVPFLFANGAKRVVPVETLEEAYALKAKNPDYVLLGEREQRPPEGFDFGNSPALIEKVDFSGRSIVHSTTAGTRGIVWSQGCPLVLAASLVNARSTVQYLRKLSLKDGDFLSTSPWAKPGLPNEDTLCAEYMLGLLRGEDIDEAALAREILALPTAARFRLPENQSFAPEGDLHLCLQFNRFDFALRAERDEDGQLELQVVR